MTWDYDFPEGPYVAPYAIGGGGGHTFILCKAQEGLLVKKIGVYYYSSAGPQAIEVTYTDGSKTRVGTQRGDYKELALDLGERATKASLWGNGVGTRCGRILINTNKNHTLDVGKNTSGQTEYNMDFGSGFLAGFAGRVGDEIDALSFVFLLPIKKAEMTDLHYEHPPLEEAISPTTLAVSTYTCESHQEDGLNWNFSNSVQRSNSYSFNSTTSQEFGSSVEVSASIPEIGSTKGGFSWKFGESRSLQTARTETTTLLWGLSGHLKPGESCTCTATC
ncbi:MAG: hypothetical protein Q9217_006079 [Psora testacea]